MPYFRGADCDTGHHLVVAKVRERFAVSKQTAQNFDAERFNVCRLSWNVGNNIRLRSQAVFSALENLNDSENINRNWETLQRISLQLQRVCTN